MTRIINDAELEVHEKVRTALQEIYNLTQRVGYVRSEQINEIAGRALAEHHITPAPLSVTDRDSGFEVWWDAYNKKVGKATALRAWRKLSLGQRASAMLDIVDNNRPTKDPAWTVADGRYQPNPSTYLINCRWEDEWQRTTKEQVKFL